MRDIEIGYTSSISGNDSEMVQSPHPAPKKQFYSYILSALCAVGWVLFLIFLFVGLFVWRDNG